jgi:hypothetical protein
LFSSIFILFYFYCQFQKVPSMDPGKPMPEKQGSSSPIFYFLLKFFSFPGANDGSWQTDARKRRQATRQRGATRRNKGAEGLKLLVYAALSY